MGRARTDGAPAALLALTAVVLAAALLLTSTRAAAQVEAEFADEFDAPKAPAAPAPPVAPVAPSPPTAPLAPPPATTPPATGASAGGAATPTPPTGVPQPARFKVIELKRQPQAAAPAAAQQATSTGPSATAAASATATGTTALGSGGDDDERAADAADAAEQADDYAQFHGADARRTRVSNTWHGPVGGIRVVDAGSGPAGTFRLQLAMDFFSGSDFLIAGDDNDWVGGILSLSWTLTDHLELSISADNHANINTRELPQLLQVLGDTRLALKAFDDVLPWLTLGGDLRLLVLNSVGDIGPVADGTSVGLRASLSANLQELEEPVPLVLRFGLDYLFDNSASLIEGVENARYDALGTDRRSRANEDRHLVRRVERFALGINRVDAFTLSFGLESPQGLGKGWFLHPILEWWLSVPVNRQDYNCLLLPTAAGPGDADGCLDREGLPAMPSTLTLAARLFPPVTGLSFTLGLDIGVSGTSTFVRELAPNKPWALLAALAYAVDTRPREAERETVEVVREVVKAPAPKPRIAGLVADRETGAPIAGAGIRYAGLAWTPQQTDEAGRFVSYGMEPGEVTLDLTHPDYEPGRCAVVVPTPAVTVAEQGAADAQAAQGAAQAAPQTTQATQPTRLLGAGAATTEAAADPATAAANGEGLLVSLRCELSALPRTGELRGSVIDAKGMPVAGAQVQVRGSATLDLTSDVGGRFGSASLPGGSYSAQIQAEGYLVKLVSFEVPAGGIASPRVELLPKPKQAQVKLTAREVRISKQIHFMTNSAEISSRSHALLSEIADVLLRNPQVERIEIQGHTDNRGSPDLNERLSQLRAEAVRDWLISAGVPASRLSARGYGDKRPLLPNITDRNRAKNRRVQFMIRNSE